MCGEKGERDDYNVHISSNSLWNDKHRKFSYMFVLTNHGLCFCEVYFGSYCISLEYVYMTAHVCIQNPDAYVCICIYTDMCIESRYTCMCRMFADMSIETLDKAIR